MSLLGIDVGTTGCKAAVFTADGICLAQAYREYPVIRTHEGYAELDSRKVFSLIKKVIAEVAAHSKQDPITALCVSSMGEAMTPVSEDRKILSGSILLSDTRGREYIDALEKRIDQEAFYAINPNILSINYSLPKLSWIRDHDPDLFRRTDKFLLWSDLVAYKLGGQALTSYSLASRTLLFDIHKEKWSETICNLAGIPVEKLPATAASGTVAGTVSESMANELGLPGGVTIVVGGHDQCCNSLGAGICEAGKAVCGIGTVECITPTFSKLPENDVMLRNGLGAEHHVLPSLYVSFVFNQSGSLVKWFRDTFAAKEQSLIKPGEDIYRTLSDEMPEEPTGLITLPYFEMTGPPRFVSHASGLISGLKTGTRRGEILKSIMESATFYFVDSIEALNGMGINTSEFIATGGGAKSSQWLQIKADILGIPFARPHVTEGSLLGAAILAGLATDVFSKPEEAIKQFVQRERVFEPHPGRHAVYREKIEQYRKMEGLMKREIWPSTRPRPPLSP